MPILQVKKKRPRQIQRHAHGLPDKSVATGAQAQIFVCPKQCPSLWGPASYNLCEPYTLRAAKKGSEHPIIGGIQAAVGYQILAGHPRFLGWR